MSQPSAGRGAVVTPRVQPSDSSDAHVRQVEILLPRLPVPAHLSLADDRTATIDDGAGEPLRESRRVSPPLQDAVTQRDVVLPRDTTLVEVEHEVLAGGVVTAEDGHTAGDLRLIDL